jgi:predicted AlkP superfamily pyrophosphatase or phosphodiesterase
MIERESVGRDQVPDLVAVNFKTPDYVSHQYGPDSPELRAALAALDEQIGRVVSALDVSAGPSGYVVAVTADHGMPSEPAAAGQSRHYVEDVVETIHDRLDPTGRRLVLDFSDPANLQIAIDEDRLDDLGLELADVARLLESFPFVRAAFTEDEVRAVRLPR